LGAGASAQWRYSVDGRSWTQIASLDDGGEGELAASIDEIVSPRRQPTYCFQLQLLLRGKAAAKDVVFEHDVQTSALSPPELVVGDNRVVYTDASTGRRRVRVTHEWLERTAWRPPLPPAEALAPRDGGVVEGTRVEFAWRAPSHPDGQQIAGYHFELSADPDMRWPLSPNFEKLISLTASRGKPRWTVPSAGLLNPDTTYYWRVRALDARGVWGPWSPTFRFRIRAAGVPLDVTLALDQGHGLTLAWRPNPRGLQPVSYKVYGSDEKGFSVSDGEYLVFRGKGFVSTMEEYEAKPADAADAGLAKTPGNLIARVTQTRLRVAGPEAALPNCNRAFYRVVAVGPSGAESGPSDYVAAPRPFVYTRPASPARVGAAYRYQPKVIRSLGDLRCRRSPASSYNAAFWDREEVTFRAIRMPAGLTLDPQTGLISGRPTRAGEFELVFEATATSGRSTTVAQRLIVAE
jgi:hypothetical protein